MELINPVINRWISGRSRGPGRASGRAPPPNCPGSGRGTASSNGTAHVPLVHRRADEPVPTTRSTTTCGRPRRPAGAHLLQRARGEARRSPTPSSSPRSSVSAAALAGHGRGQGRPAHDLHAHVSRGDHLMLATVRIGAIHSVVFAGFGEHALADRVQAQRLPARLHRRRHLPPRQGRPAQAHRR